MADPSLTPDPTPPAPVGPAPIQVTRWKVDLPGGPLKGISEADARRLAAEHGGTAACQSVRRWLDGYELLGPWQKVSGS